MGKNCTSVTIEGTAELTRIKHSRVRLQKAPHAKFIHCITPRQDIVAKEFEPEAHKMLQDVVDTVNFTKMKP